MRSRAKSFIICPSCKAKLRLDEIAKELCYIMPESKLSYVKLLCPICGNTLKKKDLGDKA